MSRRFMSFIGTLVVVVALAAPAVADIPSVSITVTPEAGRVRIDLGESDNQSNPGIDCSYRVVRRAGEETVTIFDSVLEELSRSPSCGWWDEGEGGDVAEGEDAATAVCRYWRESVSCAPLYDVPCPGEYIYEAFGATSQMAASASASVVIEDEYRGCGDGPATVGEGPSGGCEAGAPATTAHLVVVAMMALGALLPWLAARRRRA